MHRKKSPRHVLAIAALMLQVRSLKHRRQPAAWPGSGEEQGWDLNPHPLKRGQQLEAGSPEPNWPLDVF